MSETNMILNTKLSEKLYILNFVVLIYSIFLLILGLVLHNSELIVQTCIMFVIYVVFENINYDIMNVSKSGFKCEKYGFVNWDDLKKIERKDKVFILYSKTLEKPYKIFVNKIEDNREIDRIYKYMLSKVDTYTIDKLFSIKEK